MELFELAAPVYTKTSAKKKPRANKAQQQFQYLDLFEILADTASTDTASNEPALELFGKQPPVALPEDLVIGPLNYRMTAEDEPGRDLKARFNANLAAIRLMKAIDNAGRYATADEQSILCRYAGFGGIPQVFVKEKAEWQNEYNALKEALDDKEYETIRASTLNAHYTSIDVIDFIYKALMKLGFKGGRVLEPSVGVGYFIGRLAETLADKCTITATELDTITGGIAQHLYPKASIRIMGFENLSIPDNSIDIAIGNVPFGNYKVFDKAFEKFKFSIHDYFFAKSINKVRPGGILAFITSRFSMDKKSSAARQYLAERADLVAAIRLPDNAFTKVANTTVTTDIIILQKRKDLSTEKAAWVQTCMESFQTEDGQVTEKAAINNYYKEHPNMMLGQMVLDSTEHGYQLTLKSNGAKISESLETILNEIPSGIYVEEEIVISKQVKRMAAPTEIKEGAYLEQEGRVYRKINGDLNEEQLPAMLFDRTKELIKIRDKVRAVIKRQQETDTNDYWIEKDRADLNTIYDRFVKKYGYVNARTNSIAFRKDPDYPLLLALEHYDEESKKAAKADIFSKRITYPARVIKTADTAKDAMLISLNEFNTLNFERMSELTEKTEEAIIEELGDLVYKNPETGKWETAEEYLSGNVRSKLDKAILAYDKDPEFYRNVEGLKAVQPIDLKYTEIEARLGSPWVPGKDITDFINDEILEIKDAVSVSFETILGTWTVDKKKDKKYEIQNSVNNSNKWGTGRADALTLIEQALNHHVPTIKDPIDDDKYVINKIETEAAREKQWNLKERFKVWLWEDEERRGRLAEKYNKEFNNIRERTFDGSHLTFSGMTCNIKLMPHQINAIWRILQTGNTLLYHKVGHGKTYSIIASIMEMRRIGLIRKAIISVPNHLVGQWTAEILRLYPCANVLLTRKEDFERKNRKVLMSRIATGDWDAVVVAHTGFERIPLKKETIKLYIDEQIAEVQAAIDSKDGKNDTRMIKRLEAQKKRLEVDLQERIKEDKKDDLLTFEELGIDHISIDESDMFKNLHFVTKMSRVAGIPTSESQRAFDMYMKTQYLNRKYGQWRVIMATGTAISNSMSEMYTVQRYLQPQILKEYGLEAFDSWAHTFGEIVSSLEISPDGSGYRVHSRFARFTNIPELMAMFKLMADIRLEPLEGVDIPAVINGNGETIAAEISKYQKEYTDTLIARAEEIKMGEVTPEEDNMLVVCNDGMKCALDMRLIDITVPDNPDGKVNYVVQTIFGIWEETRAQKLTQIAFCDMSTPNNQTFNVYDDIRQKLIAKGIPEDEMAFIHDANTDLRKERLFEKVRSGHVRVIMGSTSKLGSGVNIQKRLFALHHIDVPWRPRDIEQREGRIIRRGNSNKEIRIYRYVTKQTFDAYKYQNVEVKARFISQIAKNNSTIRTAEDLEGAVLTFAEVKAISSGNPLVMDKFKTDNEIRRMNLLKTQYVSARYDMQHSIGILPNIIESKQKFLKRLEADTHNVPSGEFVMKIGEHTYTERKKAGFAIQKKALALMGMRVTEEIGTWGNLKLYIKSPEYTYVKPTITAVGETKFRGEISESDIGTIMSLEHDIKSLPDIISTTANEIDQLSKKLARLRDEIGKPFQHEEALNKLIEKQKEIYKELEIGKHVEGADLLETMDTAA